MRRVLFVVISIASLLSCKKEADNRPESAWYINGQRFASKNGDYYYNGKNAASLSCFDEGPVYRFGFTIENWNPKVWGDRNSSHSNCSVGYNGKVYDPPYDTFFNLKWSSMPNARIVVIIDTAWLYAFSQPDSLHRKVDSILVWGTFCAP